MIESKTSYGYNTMVSDIEEWSPPQPEQRKCPCGAILSRYNPEQWCYVCQQKAKREDH